LASVDTGDSIAQNTKNGRISDVVRRFLGTSHDSLGRFFGGVGGEFTSILPKVSGKFDHVTVKIQVSWFDFQLVYVAAQFRLYARFCAGFRIPRRILPGAMDVLAAVVGRIRTALAVGDGRKCTSGRASCRTSTYHCQFRPDGEENSDVFPTAPSAYARRQWRGMRQAGKRASTTDRVVCADPAPKQEQRRGWYDYPLA